jgi:cellulose biosynthesis protein BcsQ
MHDRIEDHTMNPMKDGQWDLEGLGKTIEAIEDLVRKLQASGAGIPMLETNTRIILSFVNVLKLGISDPAGQMNE